MSLRQNEEISAVVCHQFSYQSECHCAKTQQLIVAVLSEFSYQSECHCAKTNSNES